MDRFTGGCLCGNIRIMASERPYRVGLCHCLDWCAGCGREQLRG